MSKGMERMATSIEVEELCAEDLEGRGDPVGNGVEGRPACSILESAASTTPRDVHYHRQTQEILAAQLKQAVSALASHHDRVLRIFGERYSYASPRCLTPNGRHEEPRRRPDAPVVASIQNIDGQARVIDMKSDLEADQDLCQYPHPRSGWTAAPPSTAAPSLRFAKENGQDQLQVQYFADSHSEQETKIITCPNKPKGGGSGQVKNHHQQPKPHHHELLEVWITHRSSNIGGIVSCGGKPAGNVGRSVTRMSTTEENDRTFESTNCLKGIVVHPYNPRRAFWDMGSLLLVLYDMVMIPMAFFEPPETTGILVMVWISRLFWTLDMPVAFFTGFITGDGNIELRHSKIARRYFKSWFFLDALVVGVDWLELIATAAAEGMGFARFTKASRVFRVIRMIRLLRLARMTEVLSFLTERVDSEKLVIGIDVAKLLIIMLGSGHMIACCWYAVGNADESDQNWLKVHEYSDRPLENQYVMSLRWAVSQFSGGMDEVTPHSLGENIFAVFVYLTTFWSGAVFISILTSSMTQWYVMGSQNQQQLTTLRRYLSQNGISKKLAIRVVRNAQHSLREQQRTMPEETVLLIKEVSEPLRVEIHFEMYSPKLTIHRFFSRYLEECPHVMRKVCHNATQRSSTAPGDTVFTIGETPSNPKMFMIGDGVLEYTTVDFECTRIEGGQWIAEACLWVHWMHHGTLTAIEDTRIFTVDAHEFQAIAGQFEHLSFDPRTYAAEFLKNLNLCEEPTDLDISFPWEENEQHAARLQQGANAFMKLKSRTTNLAKIVPDGNQDADEDDEDDLPASTNLNGT